MSRWFYFILFVSTYSVAQPALQDTLFVSTAGQNAKQQYDQIIKGQSRLYRGSEYHKYQPTQAEYPYFESDDWSSGTLVYDGETYQNLLMLYDLFDDKVIIENSSNLRELELISEKVQSFTIRKHTFVRLAPTRNSFILEGFYDRLYNGNTKFFVRREKRMQNKFSDGKQVHYFSDRILYYIQKNGLYFTVKSKKSVLLLLHEKEQELKQFLNKNKIHFNSDRENAITRMVEFYDKPSN